MNQNDKIKKYLNGSGHHDMNISEKVRISYKEIHASKGKVAKKEDNNGRNSMSERRLT